MVDREYLDDGTRRLAVRRLIDGCKRFISISATLPEGDPVFDLLCGIADHASELPIFLCFSTMSESDSDTNSQ